MDALIRRKALRHAAKVAFGSLIVGCGGTIQDTGDGAADANSEADTQPTADAAMDVSSRDVQSVDSPASDAALACTQDVALDASIDDGTFECCLGVVEQLTGDAGIATVDAAAVDGDPSVANCCVAIIAHVDGTSGTYSEAAPTLPTCCSALGYPTGPACTPWGPPMPPEMVLS
jgi:hypothetical protein